MHYKYKKIVIKGVNGTQISHRQTEENPVMTLGDIDGYTYIYALELGEQHESLNFTKVSLTIDEIRELERQRFLKYTTEEVSTSMAYANISATVQKMLDESANERGYDSIISECSYATSTGIFGAEAQVSVNWRDSVWAKVFEIQNATEQPATLQEFMAMLPERL